jgi:hypothetical protein
LRRYAILENRSEENFMIGFVLASILWLWGAPAAQSPFGIVSGQIKAQDGSAASEVRVAVLPVPTGTAYTESEALGFAARTPVSTGVTDKDGRFYLDDVPPGRYYILGGLTDAPTFYPAATNNNGKQPTVVTVVAGQTVGNLNFGLLWPLGRRVSGRLKLNAGIVPGQTVTLSGSKVEEFLEVPARKDLTFEFGRVPPGRYLLSTYPPPAGLMPIAVIVSNADVVGLELTSPPTHVVSGKIVVQNGGPVPDGILSLYNIQSYISAKINPDGTFTANVHAARHTIDVAGMPVGYSLLSVQSGTTDITKGFTVGTADMSGLVVTITAPVLRPKVIGRVEGLSGARLTSAKVQMNGPVFGTLEASIQPDGSFVLPIVVPGLYSVKLSQVAEFQPMKLVVTNQAVTEVTLNVPSR